MILREIDYQEQLDFLQSANPKNLKQLSAGVWAEKSMAYELSTKLGSHKELFVLNDLKIEYNGYTAQLDHLVLSPYCMYLIETKSCYGTVYVNEVGEWTRNNKPIDSPIEQSKRHERLLLDILNENLDRFLGKILGLQKKLGAYQRYHFVAISTKGQVKGFRKKYPQVKKYDLIANEILDDYNSKHEPSLLKRITRELSDENMRLMNINELEKFAAYLLSINIGETLEEKFRTKAEQSQSAKPVAPTVVNKPKPTLSSITGSCSKCESKQIEVYNNYGYWIKCLSCNHAEKFNQTCPVCSSNLKLKKVKGEFKALCECGFSTAYLIESEENKKQESHSTKECPKCGSELVECVAKKGQNEGNTFWGCSRFPKCRYTE